MDKEARLIKTLSLNANCEHGNFFAPRAYEIDSLDQLQGEVFGPILHIIQYQANKLDEVSDYPENIEKPILSTTGAGRRPIIFFDLKMLTGDPSEVAKYQTFLENEIKQYIGKDDAMCDKILRDITPFILENPWGIYLPFPYVYDIRRYPRAARDHSGSGEDGPAQRHHQ